MHRTPVGVLGATGSVGQKLVRRLHDHPWFELRWMAASERSAGRRYADAVHWLEPEPLPDAAAGLEVASVDDDPGCGLLFSALDAATAHRVEPRLAAAGRTVVSNASALRMDPAVPLVVPEINPDHLALGDASAGRVVTNPNCATVGLVMTLAPLDDAFGVEEVDVTTLQAVSGAGYPGVPSLDILGNIIPNIDGEEDKLAAEPGKILGRLEAGRIDPHPMRVSAQVTRVPVLDGHLLSVAVRLRRPVAPEDAREAMRRWTGRVAADELPSAPPRPLEVLDGDAAPQPRLHAARGGGMTVTVGRLRRCPVLGLRYVALVHNTERGAAGAAVLNAELVVRTGRNATRVCGDKLDARR